MSEPTIDQLPCVCCGADVAPIWLPHCMRCAQPWDGSSMKAIRIAAIRAFVERVRRKYPERSMDSWVLQNLIDDELAAMEKPNE